MNPLNPSLLYELGKPRFPFETIWNTENSVGSAGHSLTKQIKLPLVSTGTYNFTVDWGDGTTNQITVWNAATTTHTYSVAGVKTIKIKTYDGMTQKNMCKIDIDRNEFANIRGASVIIVDDILDSGRTLKTILAETARHLPSSIEVAVLLDKKKTDFCADYTGFKIEDKWTFGFGMDFNSLYRNLKDIHYIE